MRRDRGRQPRAVDCNRNSRLVPAVHAPERQTRARHVATQQAASLQTREGRYQRASTNSAPDAAGFAFLVAILLAERKTVLISSKGCR